MAEQPKAKMKLMLGKTELATLFEEPEEGPIEMAAVRHHNFGTRGERELRGDTAGQVIAIRAWVIEARRQDVKRKYRDTLIKAIGDHAELKIEVTTHTGEKFVESHPKTTLINVIPVSPYQYDRSGAINNGRRDSCYRVFLLMFYKLDASDDK